MKKTVISFLALVFVFVTAFTVYIMPVSAQNLQITEQEQQDIFDAWFDFLYEDFLFAPMNRKYETYESYKDAESGRILLSDTSIYGYYGNYDVLTVQVVHKELSYMDVMWFDRVGGYNFDFSGVNSALYIYKNHKLYNLKTAYDQGIIDDKYMDELYRVTKKDLFKVGDVDKDYSVTVSDVVRLRDDIIKQVDVGTVFSDIDGDGTTSVTDVVLLRKIIIEG